MVHVTSRASEKSRNTFNIMINIGGEASGPSSAQLHSLRLVDLMCLVLLLLGLLFLLLFLGDFEAEEPHDDVVWAGALGSWFLTRSSNSSVFVLSRFGFGFRSLRRLLLLSSEPAPEPVGAAEDDRRQDE